MKISAKCDYALRAILELSFGYDRGVSASIEEIARKQGVSFKYLVQILNQLKQAGFVTSKRGRAGGYTLSKSPSRITLADVIRAIDGPLVEVSSLDANTNGTLFALKHGIMKLKDAVEKAAGGVSFEDMRALARKSKDNLVYNI